MQGFWKKIVEMEVIFNRCWVLEIQNAAFTNQSWGIYTPRVMGRGTLVHSLGLMNCEHPSNQAKKLLNNKKLPKSLAVSFLFLTFAPTFASCPTRLGFWANRVWLRICLYLWESVFMRFVSDSLKSGQFQSQSELSNGRCSCSVYTWFYARKADY